MSRTPGHTLTKTLAVFRFELAYQLRRFSTLAYFLIVVALCPMFLQVMAEDDIYFNAPFHISVLVVFGSLLALVIVAAFAGDAATRDLEVRMDPLFYTTPVGKRAYLIGRFLGAFAVSALIFVGFPLGAVLSTWMPGLGPERLAPFGAWAHVAPYILFAVPNAFVATALMFSLATLTRRSITAYAGAAFLFFFSLVCGKLLTTRLGWSTAKLLDPIGFTTIWEWWVSLTPARMNAFVLVLDGALLRNRLLWIAIGLAALGAAYVRFRFAHPAVGRTRPWSKPRPSAVDAGIGTQSIAIPPVRRIFDASTRVRQLLTITARAFRDLHSNRVWWIVPMIAVFFIMNAPDIATMELGLPGPLTTAHLLAFLRGDMSVLFWILIALSAGELVWRDRAARIHPLADVTPVPGWIPLVGQFLALALMLAAAMVIFLLAGLFVQSSVGTDRYDLALYIQVLFGLQMPEYLLIAALAIVVHVLVNQKYVANIIILLLPAVRELLSGLGVNPLLLYAELPDWVYSEISGFGTSVEERLWFTLYFGGWALLLALVTHLFRVRGEAQGLRQRLAAARRRKTRGAAIVGATALAVIAGAGGFVVYETYIRNDSPSAAWMAERSAEYERRYGRYASLPQPVTTATKLEVDFQPKRREATIRGSYRLENRTSAAIETLHVVTSGAAESTTVSFDRASRATLTDETRDYRIYALDEALRPGESLQMSFEVGIETELFGSYSTPPVLRNGSVIVHKPRDGVHWLPLVGYQTFRELDSATLRKEHGLPGRPPYPRLGDIAVGNEQKGHERVALETIVATDAGQIGVAPGELRRSWTANGRHYSHYVTDAPISNAWSITSADYAVHRAEWKAPLGNTVDIEIFHHPAHTANLERMERSAKASLDYNSRQFGAYPPRQLRFVETPSGSFEIGMSAYSGLITFQEGFSLVRPEDDPREIDFPFAVVAHEVAHQWWGHQLVPAVVEGAPFLAESLSWYSAMLVIEESLGREHLNRLLAVMRAQYMGPKQPRKSSLLRNANQLDAYRTGPFAMYAMREAVGVEPVHRALRNLLAKFPPGREPYPTSLDFYAELRATTPPQMHGFLKDLFEEITFWDLSMKSMEVAQVSETEHRVTLQIEAQKLKGDGKGNEQPAPMNDPIEIALYDAAGVPIYQARHRVRSGRQTMELLVPQPPASAVIDPDNELLDRQPGDNKVLVEGASPP